MPDIILAELSKMTTGYDAPHRYRVAKATQNQLVLDDILVVWRADRPKVLQNLVDQVAKHFDRKSTFLFAVAPSQTTFFVDDMKSAIRQVFPNSIDKSECFSKNENFQALTISRQLSEEDLRNNFQFDSTSFQGNNPNSELPILLMDDVSATGNTLNAMKLLISDLGIKRQIVTATILKTQ